MTSPPISPKAPGAVRATGERRLRADKRAAIEAAALREFAREGYGRARVESIAEQAAVSTRTLYNHFAGKQELFATVLEQSAARVARRFAEIVEAESTGEDAAHDVLVLARALAAHQQQFPEHFRMVRQLISEADHLPAAAVQAWRAAGPRVVHRILVGELERMRAAGQLALDDPHLAARQLVAMVSARALTDPLDRERTVGEEDLRVAAGVFVHGYALRSPFGAVSRAAAR